ncbi:MAG: hypothetical protein WCH39_26770 [Schlesneria sp.]
MNEPSLKTATTRRIIRGNAARIAIGAAMMAAVSIAVFIWMRTSKWDRSIIFNLKAANWMKSQRKLPWIP